LLAAFLNPIQPGEFVMKFLPFLHFDGNCGEAMEFYKQSLDAELFLIRYSEAPGDQSWVPAVSRNHVMHSTLKREDTALLMAADTVAGSPFQPGNNFSVTIECDSLDEINAFFTALSKGGTVTMPLQDTFWNAHFGMLTDKFGIRWMLNYPLPAKA
jgi:PhnB protein